MITTPTTFVVGAGASCVNRLPTSAQILRMAKSLTPHDAVYQIMLATGTGATELNEAIQDIQDTPVPSLDAFLEHRQGQLRITKITRRLLAFLLAQAMLAAREADTHSLPEEIDWLGYLFERMRKGARTPADFARGNASMRFVTFNFDSIIESRLQKDIVRVYRGVENGEVSDAVRAICRVTHVHGRLPDLPNEPLAVHHSQPYHVAWNKWIEQAEAEIRVVLDDIDETTLTEARIAVLNCDVLCFLGFAYDGENLKRLAIPSGFRRDKARTIVGSAYGLSDGEQAWVRSRFGSDGIQLGHRAQDCRTVLREIPVFFD